MAKAAARRLAHPHIAVRKDVCGGRPTIDGTRFPVHSVVNYVLRQGISPEELVREFQQLSLAQVYDALSYYYDHQADIDRELESETEEQLRPIART